MHRSGILATIAIISLASSTYGAYVVITQDGPGILNSTLYFTAQLYDDKGHKQNSETLHKFHWSDNAINPHTYTEQGDFSKSLWNVTYSSPMYSPGEYEIEVRVMKWVGFFFWDIASIRFKVNVTALLNGGLEIVQNNTILGSDYVSERQEVIHRVKLNKPDSRLLDANNTIVNAYWFVGCQYYGSSQDLSFAYNYTKDDLDQVRIIRVLVVAGRESDDNSTVAENFSDVIGDDNATFTVGDSSTPSDPDKNCEDFPIVPKDPTKYYGYFKRHIIPTAPVHVDSIQGQTWLKTGEMLYLNVTCSGSAPFYHCVRFFSGEYNVTGNETCTQARSTPNCRIAFSRLMNKGTKYTVLFIIGNRVSTTVTPVGVTRYSEKHHPQLSVIIVPISCSAVAMVIIIFGVAYYIQSRNRYKIEVADFDFSRNSDMEYKTFKERLREAFSSAFTRVKDDEYSDEGQSSGHFNGGSSNVWSPTRKKPFSSGLLEETSDSDQ